MVILAELVDFLDRELDNFGISDSSFNGLQFEGRPEIKKAMFAVDSGIEVFEAAARENADILIVHHGIFWREANPSVTGVMKRRLDILYKSQISLYASHLPLDRHHKYGNNARIINLLGAEIREGFVFREGKNIGWIGEFTGPKKLENIQLKLEQEIGDKFLILPFGKKEIKSLAVCSGGAGHQEFYSALSKGVDLYITGEASDIYHAAKDAGLNVIFAGHHATETFGVKALSSLVGKKFGIEAVFRDIKTGL
jgi:dinuclear metal center YbgI/SA1388 family protein